MKKTLSKHGNSLAVIIDKPILDILKINDKTELELSIEDGGLMIRACGKTKKESLSSSEIDEIAKKIMDKYDPVFKKLAKT
jgi:putative addiction module antidote